MPKPSWPIGGSTRHMAIQLLWARFAKSAGAPALKAFEGRAEAAPIHAVAFADWLMDQQQELNRLEDAFEKYQETGQTQNIEIE